MARRKLREYDAKRILRRALMVARTDVGIPPSVQVTSTTDWAAEVRANPWLATGPLVAKVDALFGKRGLAGLVKLNATLDEVKAWCAERLEKEVVVNGRTGVVTHCLIEQFVPHTVEHYFSLDLCREGIRVHFSAAGGVEIDSNWGSVRSAVIPLTPAAVPTTSATGASPPSPMSPSSASPGAVEAAPFPPDFFAGAASPAAMEAFANAALAAAAAAHFTTLEFNPVAAVGDAVVPLDVRAMVDDTAEFLCHSLWGPVDFPAPFGRTVSAAEEKVAAMDAKTGASLKLVVLNPRGRVWNLVAGGGASVIYADTVSDCGLGHELGNYGEYSGNPTEDDTYEYARIVLGLATHALAPKGRCVIIGGGIANFTDVAATFKGIIRALIGAAPALRACDAAVFVRRAGPNFEKALGMMRAAAPSLGVPVVVHGPEVAMTVVVFEATEWLRRYDAEHPDAPVPTLPAPAAVKVAA